MDFKKTNNIIIIHTIYITNKEISNNKRNQVT